MTPYTFFSWAFLIFLPFVPMRSHWKEVSKFDSINEHIYERKEDKLLISADTLFVDQLSDDLTTYYAYINLAARAIYDNRFEEASALYDSAFVYKTNPFFEDLKNYILLNAKCGFTLKNELPLHKIMMEKHVDSTQLFLHLPKRLFSNENLMTIKKLAKAQKKAKHKEATLYKALTSIFILDQDIRDYEGISQKDYETRKAIYARVDSVDQENFIVFEKIYKQFGFPTEDKLGVFYDNDHQWAEVIYLLLRHFVQNGSEEEINKILLMVQKAFYAGELHPSIYATLLELIDNNPQDPRPGFNFMNTTMNLVLGEIYRPFVFYTDSLMNEVNANRISIGLDSFHITQKQVVCQYTGYKDIGEKKFIKMVQYAQIDELPPGWVKKACEEANIDMASFKINTTKILHACRCEEKIF